MTQTIRLTMAQALVRFLAMQTVERDGQQAQFFAGCWGIFGHGNVAGIGQALQQYAGHLKYYQARNEQGMVHAAVAYAKAKNRLGAFACTSSIGPGALNMVTGAAVATVNRLPVLLLPGDIFAERIQSPVLQQLECEWSQDASVNDCFKPVSRYWDRINRPEQLMASLPEAMRVLTSPAQTGAVTLALPQDVQAMAWDYPAALFDKRVWYIPRQRPDTAALQRAVHVLNAASRPLIIAGGGVHYSEAYDALRRFAESAGIPVGETQAGKGALPYNHPLNLGAIGVTGTPGANIMCREADVIIGIGTRYSDFTTMSNSAFQNPDVRFININVAEFDSAKRGGIALTGDARVTLEELAEALDGWRTSETYQARAREFNASWDMEVARIYNLEHEPMLSQGEVLGVVNTLSRPEDVVVCAAGSMPGDLHKLWRTRDHKGYHLEYGFSTMGYEIAGGLGIKMAQPERDLFVMVGDASYLMLNTEIVTAVQEGIKLIIVLIDNHGYASIGGLSKSVGSDGFGTKYRYRTDSDQLDGEVLPVDYAANAASMGADVIRANTRDEVIEAVRQAQASPRTTCIVVETDRRQRVPGYESWWDVAVAEVSDNPDVQTARAGYEQKKANERHFI
ncbi:MAG: 3D-(3,5/4)-trihydroxycyclohexane-1,2-dione acylhydrolase (decyclizing) [Pleurocapsa minor GSE-CHR-MK-17-07R]|jgi:3D-(3,5/4)-trihydroxycyclohexane-1,2-dione acylhydrolase (decyclizing)|nr:3D-(3,5/4)-trihydroxycyclohexane-1,2-dione acylhydrolase (decyclizing) [Pleurocapsa minor GSE-CHR-MK 17-07R]